jgi:peptide deformylase
MEILKYPDPHLFIPCKEVTVFTPELKILLDSMWETMKIERGLGLAANQVGLSYRMFTMEGPNNEKLYIVNPKILDSAKTPSSVAEGCLSAPGQMIKLYRPLWVKLSFFNENGEQQERVFHDVFSVCVQHEMEHLSGKSYLQNKAIPKKLRMFLAKKWGLKVK